MKDGGGTRFVVDTRRRHGGTDAVQPRARLENQTNVLLGDVGIDMRRVPYPLEHVHKWWIVARAYRPTYLRSSLDAGRTYHVALIKWAWYGVCTRRSWRKARVIFCRGHTGWYDRRRTHLLVYSDLTFRPRVGYQTTATHPMQYQGRKTASQRNFARHGPNDVLMRFYIRMAEP